MLLSKDISTSQEYRKNSNYKASTIITHVKAPHVNMERNDRWHPCECGLPFPRGLPILVCLLVCPSSVICWHGHSLKEQNGAVILGTHNWTFCIVCATITFFTMADYDDDNMWDEYPEVTPIMNYIYVTFTSRFGATLWYYRPT